MKFEIGDYLFHYCHGFCQVELVDNCIYKVRLLENGLSFNTPKGMLRHITSDEHIELFGDCIL